jgi:hypothetical protein
MTYRFDATAHAGGFQPNDLLTIRDGHVYFQRRAAEDTILTMRLPPRVWPAVVAYAPIFRPRGAAPLLAELLAQENPPTPTRKRSHLRLER